MNIQTTRINTANATASGVIALRDLNQKLDKIAQKVSKTIKIAGFRQGKVPTSIVKTRYKDSIEQDAQRELIQEMLDSALKDLKIKPQDLIGDPLITKFDKGEENIDVEIKISIVPEFSLDNITDKIPTPKIPVASSKQIEERLEKLAKSRANLVESKAQTLKKGNVANIDFEGFIDGVAFEGGKAQGFDLEIGSGQFIPGFEDSLVGAKLNEQKDINVTFPKDYHSTNLAGKDATFKVKVNKIREYEQVVIDDALAQKILSKDSATLQELHENITQELNAELKNKYYNDEMKEKCLEALHSSVSFDLPDLIVEQEIDVLFRNTLSRIPKDELKQYQQDPQKAKDKRETFRDEAKKSVKVTFIIDAIAKARKISIPDNDVMSAIYYESLMNGQNPKETIDYYKENNLLPAIKMAMIENRVLNALLDEKAGINAESKSESSAKSASKESKKQKGQ